MGKTPSVSGFLDVMTVVVVAAVVDVEALLVGSVEDGLSDESLVDDGRETGSVVEDCTVDVDDVS